MAPVYSLEIADWRTEYELVYSDKPYLRDYFSTNHQRNDISFDFKGLKYFDDVPDLNISVMQSKFSNSVLDIAPIRYNPYKLFYEFHSRRADSYPAESIRTSRSVLTKIMTTPFEIMHQKSKWIIKAVTNSKGTIRLYYDEQNFNINCESLARQDELLKRYLFVKKPFKYYTKVISVFDEIFSENYQLQIGENSVIYSTEIPAIVSDVPVNDLDQLRKSQHVYYELFETDDFTPEIINYNPICWSKATLVNAKQCILAVYNKSNNSIDDIIKFNVDKFNDKTKYEHLWSTDGAWNFLNDFLKFVKDAVNSVAVEVREKCVWNFESFPNNKPCVTCETLIGTLSNGKKTFQPLDNSLFT